MRSFTSASLSRPLANLACMLSMLVWAAGLPAADLLIGPVPPLLLTAVRIALAAICLLPVWWFMEGGATIKTAGWLKGIAIGGGTIGFGAFLLAAGQGMTNAVTAVVIAASMPVVGIAIEVVLDGRKITASLLVGLVLSFAGGLMALSGSKDSVGLGLGAALCFSSMVFYTLGSRMTVTSFPQLSALGQTTITLCGAAIGMGAAAAINALLGGQGPDWSVLGLKELGALAIYSIGGLAISQVLWIVSIGNIGIALSSLHMNATPFYVMLILFAMGGAWNWTQAFAAAIVGLGVLIAQGVIPLWGFSRLAIKKTST